MFFHNSSPFFVFLEFLLDIYFFPIKMRQPKLAHRKRKLRLSLNKFHGNGIEQYTIAKDMEFAVFQNSVFDDNKKFMLFSLKKIKSLYLQVNHEICLA